MLCFFLKFRNAKTYLLDTINIFLVLRSIYAVSTGPFCALAPKSKWYITSQEGAVESFHD